MLDEYSLKFLIEIDESEFKKMISEVECEIFQLENEIKNIHKL
jgi:hypothetical protein